MKIYYYHTRPIKEALQEWEDKKHPGHILYGLTHFSKYGVNSVLHNYKHFSNRILLMLYNLREVLFCKESFEMVYGTSFRGLELLIFLRALGLYRKPIVIWHHTAIVSSSGKIKNTISRLFYKGIDLMFLFSRRLIEESLYTGKAPEEKLKLIHWGADIDFYEFIRKDETLKNRGRFISTGKENRDFVTLLKAFAKTNQQITIFTSRSNGDKNYEMIFEPYTEPGKYPNIDVRFVEGIIPYELAKEVAQSSVVVISCLKYHYTVGLTTLVEALALGIPVITTRNPYFEMDIDKEEAGISVDYDDIEGWIKAINYIASNPEKAKQMGEKGKALASNCYNLDNYTHEMADEMLNLKNRLSNNK